MMEKPKTQLAEIPEDSDILLEQQLHDAQATAAAGVRLAALEAEIAGSGGGKNGPKPTRKIPRRAEL